MKTVIIGLYLLCICLYSLFSSTRGNSLSLLSSFPIVTAQLDTSENVIETEAFAEIVHEVVEQFNSDMNTPVNDAPATIEKDSPETIEYDDAKNLPLPNIYDGEDTVKLRFGDTIRFDERGPMVINKA